MYTNIKTKYTKASSVESGAVHYQVLKLRLKLTWGNCCLKPATTSLVNWLQNDRSKKRSNLHDMAILQEAFGIGDITTDADKETKAIWLTL